MTFIAARPVVWQRRDGAEAGRLQDQLGRRGIFLEGTQAGTAWRLGFGP